MGLIQVRGAASAVQYFYMGPSMESRGDLPAVPNAAVDHIASGAEVWCEPRCYTLCDRLALNPLSTRGCNASCLTWRTAARRPQRDKKSSQDPPKTRASLAGLLMDYGLLLEPLLPA